MPVTGVNPDAAMQLQQQAQIAAQQRLMGPPTPGGNPGGPRPPAIGLDRPGNPAAPPPFASGAFDPRGIQGIAARGDNVYMGGLPAAPGAGRPRNPTPTMADTGNPAMQEAIQRRMQNYGKETAQHKTAAQRRGAR
jgi:hypothetical protein